MSPGISPTLRTGPIGYELQVQTTKEGLSPRRISIVEAIFMVFVVSLSLVTTLDRNYFSLLICVAAELGKRRVLRLS